MQKQSNRLPRKALDACEFCGKRVEVNSHYDLAMKVTGWIEARKVGGANSVRLPSKPQAFAHKLCLADAVRVQADNLKLF